MTSARDEQHDRAADAPGPTTASDDVERALGRQQQRASCGSRSRKSASSDAGSRPRSCRCIPRRPTRGDRSVTPLELHLEQLVHRQLAARVGQADHHAVDAAAATRSRGMSSMVPMTPGLSTGAPTRAGSGSTKPTISTPSSWRRSNSSRASVDRRRRWCRPAAAARAAPTRRVSQSKAEPPADDQRDRRAAPAMRKTPRPMISSGTRSRRARTSDVAPSACSSADEQLAAIGDASADRRGRRSSRHDWQTATISSALQQPPSIGRADRHASSRGGCSVASRRRRRRAAASRRISEDERPPGLRHCSERASVSRSSLGDSRSRRRLPVVLVP